MITLSKSEEERYARHIILSEIGKEGQEKLKKAKVLIVGIGGLGSPLALYLSAAGIGTIGLIDDDIVSISNLQRQVLYNTEEIGKPKVEIAAEKLRLLNPNINFIAYNTKLEENNANNIIENYDIIVDGCDNLPTRYLIDKTCKKYSKTYIYGSIAEFTGQVSVFDYKESGSYSDLFPYKEEANMISQSKGVIGILPGIIGNLQVNEVLKVICGYGDKLINKLLIYDAIKNSIMTVKIK